MENPYDTKLWERCDVFGNLDKGGTHRIKGSRITTEFGLTCLRLGWIEGKAEQAEIVSELVKVLSIAECLNIIRAQEPELYKMIVQAIAKAKGE